MYDITCSGVSECESLCDRVSGIMSGELSVLSKFKYKIHF